MGIYASFGLSNSTYPIDGEIKGFLSIGEEFYQAVMPIDVGLDASNVMFSFGMMHRHGNGRAIKLSYCISSVPSDSYVVTPTDEAVFAYVPFPDIKHSGELHTLNLDGLYYFRPLFRTASPYVGIGVGIASFFNGMEVVSIADSATSVGCKSGESVLCGPVLGLIGGLENDFNESLSVFLEYSYRYGRSEELRAEQEWRIYTDDYNSVHYYYSFNVSTSGHSILLGTRYYF